MDSEGAEADMATDEDLVNGPLFSWIKTFHEDGGHDMSYEDLLDGVFLLDVMDQLDPRPLYHGVSREKEMLASRMKNFQLLLNNIQSFYEELLGQMVLLSLPDLVTLCREPSGTAGKESLRSLLLLLLGCAVQCDQKQAVIERIKGLDYDTQHAIVQCIKEITESGAGSTWPLEWTELPLVPKDQQEPSFTVLVTCCRNLASERSQYYQQLLALVIHAESMGGKDEKRDGTKEDIKLKNGTIGPPDRHLAVELAATKAKLRRNNAELEEKTENIAELKDELEHSKTQLGKYRQENLELVQEARSAKALRDELDILRERAVKVDRLEQELSRYRERVHDIDFYKARVDELREDNKLLVETKEMLEDQLESSRKRSEQVLELESKNTKLKAELNVMLLERDADREKLKKLMEENSHLQMMNKSSLDESNSLIAKLDYMKIPDPELNNSLSEQLSSDAQTRLYRLQQENQKLVSLLDSLRESSFHDTNEKIIELEKENKRLSLKVEELQETLAREQAQCMELHQQIDTSRNDSRRLQDTLETVRENSNRHTQELQRENQHLVELVDNLRERQQKTRDARLADVENENKRLSEVNQELQTQLSRLEYEKGLIERLTDRLKESSERLADAEQQREELQRENHDLNNAIIAFKASLRNQEKLETEHTEQQLECRRLQKMLDNLRDSYNKLESSSQDAIKMKLENEKLQRNVDSLKVAAHRAAEVEQEKDTLAVSNQHLNNSLHNAKMKIEQLELDVMSLNNENHKLQKNLDGTHRRLKTSEKEGREVENENNKMLKTIETLKVSARKLNELEKENTELEADNHKLERENASYVKEITRLKQSLEVKDSSIDDLNSRIILLERQGKQQNKELENSRGQNQKLEEAEKENRELVEKKVLDSKTLVALREELVQEKLKKQQLSAQLDQLTAELQKIGVDKEKLTSQDDSRFRALETLLEEAVKRSVEAKEQQVIALESRLAESTSRNSRIKEELNTLRAEYEALQQRHQETEGEKSITESPEVCQLKCRVEVLDKQNQLITNEKEQLVVRESSWHEQVGALQQQVSALAQHAATLQASTAKLQVDNTTLQTQNHSLISQNQSLQETGQKAEREKANIEKQMKDLKVTYSSLIQDHEKLQKLHEQLATEYESLKAEQAELKLSNRNTQKDYKSLQERYDNVISGQDDVDRLREVLEGERTNLKADSKSLANLRAEHSRLKEDFRNLFSTNEKLKTEYRHLQTDYKQLKTDNNQLRLSQMELQGQLDDASHMIGELDVKVSKLTNQCEVLSSLNTTLEDERRSLMNQVSVLLTQYHDLLTQTLDDRQHFHNEEKTYADTLNNLKRQKEKLEEKIMEQYRRMENTSFQKKRSFGANLVRRVRKAGSELIQKVPKSRGRSRERLDESAIHHTDSQDSTSTGSPSVSGGSESPPESLNRTASAGDLIDTDSNRAKDASLSPIDYRQSLPPGSRLFEEHGSLSSSRLYDEHPSLSSGEMDSLKESLEGDLGPPDGSSMDGHSSYSKHNGTTPDEMSSNRLSVTSLGSTGTRRAVYYSDEHDTIPTRDVGLTPNHQKQPSISSNNSSEFGVKVTPSSGSSTPTIETHKKCSSPAFHSNNSLNRQGSARLPSRSSSLRLPSSTSSPLMNNSPAPPLPARRRNANGGDSNSSNIGQRTPRIPPKPTSTENNNSEKPDNSVWYEYGCV